MAMLCYIFTKSYCPKTRNPAKSFKSNFGSFFVYTTPIWLLTIASNKKYLSRGFLPEALWRILSPLK